MAALTSHITSERHTSRKDTLTAQLYQELRTLGFFDLDAGISRLAEEVREMGIRTVTEAPGTKFARYPTGLPLEWKPPFNGRAIIVDVGGTSTKAFERESLNGNIRWNYLFEKPNYELCDPHCKNHSYVEFSSNVAQLLRKTISHPDDLAFQENRLGFVWSNPSIISVQKNGSISAEICSRDTEYLKKEPFNRDTKNGDRIIEPILEALCRTGIQVDKYIVSNDGSLIPLAHNGSHGAAIGSTGVNGVIVIQMGDKKMIFNCEMGKYLVVDPAYLGVGDMRTDRQVNIQDFIGGNFYPHSYARYLSLLALSMHELRGFRDLYEKHGALFTAPVISDLAKGHEEPFRTLCATHNIDITDSSIALCKMLAQASLRRTARALSLVCYASIAPNLERLGDENISVAVDSRVALEYHPIIVSADAYFSQLLAQHNKSGRLHFVRPIMVGRDRVSPALQGLVQACDNLG